MRIFEYENGNGQRAASHSDAGKCLSVPSVPIVEGSDKILPEGQNVERVSVAVTIPLRIVASR